MLTIEALLQNRAKYDELPADLKANLKKLHAAIFDLETAYGQAFKVTSGYRPPAVNAAVGGAKISAHTQCLAVDIADKDGKLWAWCLQNLELLQKLGIYLEDKRWTPTWIHCQVRRPSSGHRIFIPNTNPPADARLWDGKYDKKFDS